MLRGIVGQLTRGSRRRPVGGTRPTGTAGTPGAASPQRDVERGARTMLRGFLRRR